MPRNYLLLATAMSALAVGLPAAAETVQAQDGAVTIGLSADQMSRILVRGQRIVAVRSVDDPDGPQVLLQNDPATGDLFVAFESAAPTGDFSVFITTDRGQTYQLLLHPETGPARTVDIIAEPGGGEGGSDALRTNGYAETVVAFLKLMFNERTVDGVSYEPSKAGPVTKGDLQTRVLGYYRGEGIRGIVLLVTNTGKMTTELRGESFLVAHVIAAGLSAETLIPGASAHVYVVEEAR